MNNSTEIHLPPGILDAIEENCLSHFSATISQIVHRNSLKTSTPSPPRERAHLATVVLLPY
jgi:hypothetical protein